MFVDFLETLKPWIVLILKNFILIYIKFSIVEIMQPWWLSNVEIWFQKFEDKKEPIAWPNLCLKRPFYGDFSGVFVIQIQPKTAEKAKCQFPWPLFWPCKFSAFKHQRHLWTALYNRAKSSISFSWLNTPNWGKKRQNSAWFYFQHSGIAENLK